MEAATPEHRHERIVVETERYRFTADVTLPPEGYRSRVTDYLNHLAGDFIALTDVVVEPLDGSASPVRHEFVAVSRHHVVLAHPAADN